MLKCAEDAVKEIQDADCVDVECRKKNGKKKRF